MPPCSYTPCMFVHPLYIHMPPAPYAPHTLLCLCVILEALYVVGVVMGSPLCWDTLPYITPVWGCLPFITPPTVIGSLCIGMFQGYQYVMWAFPSCQEGFRDVSPSGGGFRASALEMSICSFLYLFCSALCLTFRLQL